MATTDQSVDLLQYIDYTYVRAQSPQLDATLRHEVAAFSNDLRRVCAVGPSAGAGATGGLGDGGIRAGQVPRISPTIDLIHAPIQSTLGDSTGSG